jgi:hypothetical protein
MTVENHQNLVIGCGVGGKHLAWNLAKRERLSALFSELQPSAADGQQVLGGGA